MNIEVPYATEPRPDTGVSNATLGMWLFIASEVMLFGSLFSAYALLRLGAPAWPDQSTTLNVPLAAINTGLLVLSSIVMLRAVASAQTTSLERTRRLLGVVFALGGFFLVVKAIEYRNELNDGLLPATSNFLGLYFTLTGLHALHVIGGLCAIAHLWFAGGAMGRDSRRRFISRLRMTALYWNFIDVIWIVMFTVLYLL